MAKYTVLAYALVEISVDADTPEQAEDIALSAPLDLEIVKVDSLSDKIIDYSIAWSDCMGNEVRDENGETVMENW